MGSPGGYRISLTTPDTARHRFLGDLLMAGLEAVDPFTCVERALEGTEGADPPLDAALDSPGSITVLALGKAGPAMARGAARILGRRAGEMVIVSDHREAVPEGAELIVSSHPLPDETSVTAGRRLLAAAAEADHHVLFLISGGGSSLAEVPAAGLTIEDVTATNSVLVRSGLTIEDINAIRSHLSAFKGGRLGAAATVPTTTVLLSDVGRRAHLVASGPTIPSPTTPDQARSIVDIHGLEGFLPPAARRALASADSGPETVDTTVVIAGDGALAARAAVEAAQRREVGVYLLTTDLDGLAHEAAAEALEAAPPGMVSVLAGETTVEVDGDGTGGRNQEAALAAALEMEDSPWLFVAFGTDGVDGPTDAAGAMVDGTTTETIRRSGIDPVAALADNDSHRALDAAGALIRCGPTGTNVADLWLVDKR